MGIGMKSYGQYCPVARAADILNERWTLLIMRDLIGGATRFNEIHRGVPRMSPSLLSKRLKDLEAIGLIERRRQGDRHRREYRPTQAGLEIKPIIEMYGVWGQRWVRNRIGKDELDVKLLMWFMQCGIDRSHFPEQRSVIRFEFTDRPRLRDGNWWVDVWWLIIDPDEVDLCVQDPGLEVDLYVKTDLLTMTRISTGDTPINEAVRSSSIELDGCRCLEKSFAKWLPRSTFAEVRRPPDPLDLKFFLRVDHKT